MSYCCYLLVGVIVRNVYRVVKANVDLTMPAISNTCTFVFLLLLLMLLFLLGFVSNANSTICFCLSHPVLI